MKDIKEAIQASITTDSIIHATVNAADIYEAMGGVEYDDAIEVDGAYDVWGADEDDNTWRLLVNIQSPEHAMKENKEVKEVRYQCISGYMDDEEGAYEIGEEIQNIGHVVSIQEIEKTYMNPESGSIDTYEGWDYTTEDGEQVNAVDLGEVVEIVKDNDGQWREI